MSERNISVVTTGRQDWGLLQPVCRRLEEEQSISLQVLAGGMACDPSFGRVVDQIRRTGISNIEELDWDASESSAGQQISQAARKFVEVLTRRPPHAVMLLGDRYETATAALSCTVLRIPIIHLYGGEETGGAFDDALRHAITKLSHLHLVAHKTYAQRVVQMGEDPSVVHVVGSLGAENALSQSRLSRNELERRVGLTLNQPVGVVTIHPTTLCPGQDNAIVEAVIRTMKLVPATWVITLPNNDPGARWIRDQFQAFAASQPNCVAIESLGMQAYISLLSMSVFVLGNSSSGLTEAPAIGVPTVNVGDRQAGRIRCPSVIDAEPNEGSVLEAVNRALHMAQANSCRVEYALKDCIASKLICEIVRTWKPDVRKTFHRWRDEA